MSKRQKLSRDNQYKETKLSKKCVGCGLSGSEIDLNVYILNRGIPKKFTAVCIREEKYLHSVLNGEYICENCDVKRGHYCCKCKQWKQVSEFAVRNDIPQGHQSRCKECQKGDSKKTKDPIKKFLWNYRCEQKCEDCGESDPFVIEFDHSENSDEKATFKRNPDKKIRCMNSITNLEDMKTELKKCTPRCRLCHLKRTRAENPGNNLKPRPMQNRQLIRNEKIKRGKCCDCDKKDDVEYFSFLYRVPTDRQSISTIACSTAESSTADIISAFQDCDLVCPKCEVYRRFNSNPKFTAQLKWFVKIGYPLPPRLQQTFDNHNNKTKILTG